MVAKLYLKQTNTVSTNNKCLKDTVLLLGWRKKAILLTSLCKQSCAVKITHTTKKKMIHHSLK